MAVQAQYPSNVLLLNRNGQEMKNALGNEYSLQTQTGGLLDQSSSHIFFNTNNTNGVMNVNPRKRGRDASAIISNANGGSSSATATPTTLPINLFSLQPQPPPTTLINLSQLHNQQQQQPNLVSTGLRLAFGEQQQQNHNPHHPHHHHHQQQQQQQQSSLVLPSSSLSSILSDDLSTQIKQQRDEIDHFLQLQGDQLRRTLAERRQAHYRALLSVAEESASRRLREKETEVEKATRRNAELEERVAQLRLEAQVWQNKARTQEATAASLQVQLQQAMMSAQDKREEGCSGGVGEADDAESAHIDPERVTTSCTSTGPSCKACREGIASVVLLPCRHLSLCTNCNATVDTCPLCLAYRSASVEVYLS